jgi:diguanylate cyclase (GGDEF)-like protein
MADLRTAGFHDADPGLFSLSQIMHLMRVEFGRAQRYGYPLSVLVIAIDRLGHLRDLHGYEAKEAVLESVAKLLQKETRTCDFLGRLADDRLLAVVPHTPESGAGVVAGRLLEGVRGIALESEGKKIPVTISVGAATMGDSKTLFFDQLVAAAESALEDASAGGGGRVVQRDPAKA